MVHAANFMYGSHMGVSVEIVPESTIVSEHERDMETHVEVDRQPGHPLELFPDIELQPGSPQAFSSDADHALDRHRDCPLDVGFQAGRPRSSPRSARRGLSPC